MILIRTVLSVFLLLFSVQVAAQDVSALPAEVQADFDARVEIIASQLERALELEARRDAEETELIRSILTMRMDAAWTDVFDKALSLAKDVAKQRDAGFEVATYEATLAADLSRFPAKAMLALERINATTDFPSGDLEPAELVRADQELWVSVQRYDAVLSALVDYTVIAGALGLDASAELEYLLQKLPDTAANRSTYLAMALDRVSVNRAAAATLPDDMSLGDRARAAEARVRIASRSLQESARLMDAMGLETRAYRQQILTATGEVTADVLDVGIIQGLIVQWSEQAAEFTMEEGPRVLFRVLLVALIVFVAARLGRLARRLTLAALKRGATQMSHLLQQMVVSSIGNIIFLIGLLIGLSQLGISIGPLLAGLGIVGFIVGFALQDTLSNFASGLMILMYRPFDVGDFVDAGGVSGRVEKMNLVNTTFKTFDNQVLIVPNSEIWQSVITNMTAQKTRRVDLTVRIPYEEDVARVESVLRDLVASYDKVLDDPRPNIRVHELGESAVQMIVRPWVKTEDYWDTYWDLTRAIKERFDAEGIRIPFPQRTVHTVPAGTSTSDQS